MYNASADFHVAVKAGNPQMPLLIFSDAVFTAEDIDVNAGIEFDDLFNTEEDLAIGQTLKNHIRFSLFNDNQYLNDYEFGEFIATIGVMLTSSTYTQTGTISVTCGGNTYIAYSTSPYLKRNGSALSTQPTGELANIVIYDGYVYAFQKNGGYKVYKDSDGSVASVTMNSFMTNKFKKPTMYGAYFNKNANTLALNRSGVAKTYEFVPLGKFIADRPDAPMVSVISMACDDQMKKFDVNMPSDTALNITYPTTISTLYTKMCTYLGVSYETATFINSDGAISKRPKEFDNATMRQVLAWIAEAAASNAKFSRDGVLRLEWLKTTTVEMDEHDYRRFDIHWYETQKVDKLYNRTQGMTDNTYGSGNVGYLIFDNPLLKGVS